ncbi:MAG: phosphoribosylaminoimidazolesuccinocarboxamide synthase [Thermoleophilaceae bacterium]|nr:phosphoribosylaminoimidazolesuccinocarboxamide synthase [Thermoleophilaceae bacterium]
MSQLPSNIVPDQLELLSAGKVRDTYIVDDHRLLMVTSDRISTYDVIHPTPVPDKGRVLTAMSVFWFEQTAEICANHLLSYSDEVPPQLRGRAMLVRRLEMFPIECVVRGYLAGSGWSDYQASGSICGIELPAGLTESAQLPEPIFTPATKADIGDHDENINQEQASEILGDAEVFAELKRLTLAVYAHAAAHAKQRGIILADTKFEFGRDPRSGEIVLADEVLTPDSSRYWPLDGYAPGGPQPSFDKQFVRDWAASTGWDKSPPAPALPDDVVQQTRARYIEAYERISQRSFSAWQIPQ